MAGTNAVAVKTALINVLKASPPANTVVDYGYTGKSDTGSRQYVWGGKVTFEQGYSALTSGRKPRDELVTVEVHVTVYQPGGTFDVTDQAAVTIGAVVEDAIANDPQLGGAITGLRYAGIQGGEIDNSIDDDGVATLLTYRVQFHSRLF